MSEDKYDGIGSLNMKKIRITPIAFESFGVRSMCTLVETNDVHILLDPGVALGPRFRLTPHPDEYRALRNCRSKIREAAETAKVVTASHYHNDHHTPNFRDSIWLESSPTEAEAIYRGKVVLAKDARSSINFSQRKRGWMFERFCRKIAKKFEVADSNTFHFGQTMIRFSEPVPHGEENTYLGWVLLTIVTCHDEKVIHAPDVQGPMSEQTTKLIADEKPDLLILGCPPLYLAGAMVWEDSVARGMKNCEMLMGSVGEMIFDHHLLRSDAWPEATKPVKALAKELGRRVCTAAEYIGESPNILEHARKELYSLRPPSKKFLNWVNLPTEKRRSRRPPLD